MQKSRPTHEKRQREQKLVQKRKDKAARLRDAQAESAQQRAQRQQGIDPDIAGIKPGPQPSPWADFAPPMAEPGDGTGDEGE